MRNRLCDTLASAALAIVMGSLLAGCSQRHSSAPRMWMATRDGPFAAMFTQYKKQSNAPGSTSRVGGTGRSPEGQFVTMKSQST